VVLSRSSTRDAEPEAIAVAPAARLRVMSRQPLYLLLHTSTGGAPSNFPLSPVPSLFSGVSSDVPRHGLERDRSSIWGRARGRLLARVSTACSFNKMNSTLDGEFPEVLAVESGAYSVNHCLSGPPPLLRKMVEALTRLPLARICARAGHDYGKLLLSAYPTAVFFEHGGCAQP